MKLKIVPVSMVFLAALLAGSSFIFYQSGVSERQKRAQKEHELSQKQNDLSLLEAQITDLNKSMAGYRDTFQKKINALEMSALEKEGTAKTLKDQLENLKKEKEATLRDGIEKGNAIAELTDRLATLQEEKETLLKDVAALKKNADELKKQLQSAQERHAAASASKADEPQSAQASDEPFGIASDKDLGAKIDPVNLGEIVVSKTSGKAVRVQEVNAVYDFIIIDAGERDGIREGSVMNIVRHNALIGKAVIRHTRLGASAALVLPEWKKAPIEKGDLITKF